MTTVNGSAPGEEPGRKGLHHDLQTKHSLNAEQIEACFGPVILLPVWAGHINKIPNNGQSNVSVNSPLLWKPLLEVLETQQGVAGVCLNLSGGVRLPDPDTGDIYRLVGIDVDKVTGPIELLEQLNTYTEISPSGRGRRAFCLVSEEWARQYKDNAKIELPNCDHAEIYLGSGARQLTITFEVQGISKPIRVLDGAALDVLAPLLKPANTPRAAPPLPPIVPGELITDFSRYRLTPEQIQLTKGELPKGQRNEAMLGFLVRLFNGGVSREDALATVYGTSGLWDYCTSKRDSDEKAEAFARDEVDRAWGKSKSGKLEKVIEQYKRSDLIGPIGKTETATTADAPPRRKSISQQLAEVKAPVWLIEGVLQKGHLVAVVGLPNGGKTAVALDLLLRIAAGKKLGNRRVERARVAYVAGENAEEIKLRIRIWCALHELEPTELDAWFYLIDEPVFFDQGLTKHIAEGLAEFVPEVVGIDTFSSCFSGESENSAVDSMKWFSGIRENLVNPFGCAALILHHPPKHADNPLEWRGSGAALGTLDAIWGCGCAAGAITLTQGKRRGPPFDDLHWRLHTKQANWLKDNFGNVVESVVALPADIGIVNGHEDDLEIRICAALDAGKTTYRDIAALIGSSAATVGRTLPKMKKATGARGKLVRECQGELRLTAEGKTLAVVGRILLAGRLGNPSGEG